MSLLSLRNLSVRLRGRAILEGVTLDVGEGEFVGLIGPNGAGKTTLMRAGLGLLPHEGTSSLAALPPAERGKTRRMDAAGARHRLAGHVETLVALGRTPHLGGWQGLGPQDRAHVDAALATMGMEGLRHRTATRLSGGEQAMALIARALAQDTPLLMADEPIAGLDPANQIATMQVFARLAQEGPRRPRLAARSGAGGAPLHAAGAAGRGRRGRRRPARCRFDARHSRAHLPRHGALCPHTPRPGVPAARGDPMTPPRLDPPSIHPGSPLISRMKCRC